MRGVKSSIKRLRLEEQAAEIVEMAFILPLLLMLLIGIWAMARAYNVYETVNRAAREGARIAVAPTCFACGNNWVSVSETGCGGADPVAQAVINALNASSLPCTPQVQVSIAPHLSPGTAPIQASEPSGSKWTAVTVTYPYQFVLPFTPLNATTIHISATAQMVEEP